MGTTHALAVTHVLAAATKAKSSSSFSFLLIILVVFAGLYFVMIRPQRNRQRQAQQGQRQADVGARIRTTAGMYGKIIEADNDNVLVEFAPGVQIKMMRRAIMNVVPDEEPDGIQPSFGDDQTDADSAATAENREDLSI
jgi:preprotein translocase subunit YajC